MPESSNFNEDITPSVHTLTSDYATREDSITIAFVADARPKLAKDSRKLTGDFNQILRQSPTGRVDAVVMIGDMEPINNGSVNTDAAYEASAVKDIPVFFVLGNHELQNAEDAPLERAKFADYSYSPRPGPDGSRNTTYSFELGDMHVVVINEYWDGDANNKCNWHVPGGGLDADDSCFKYDKDNGGFIPDSLFDWIKDDLGTNNKKWIIAAGHEPLYPWGRQIGKSLDANKTNRDKLEDMLVSKNVTAFLAGHTHNSGFKTVDNVIHANVGVIGNYEGYGDSFSSIIYAYVNKTGYFFLEQKYENPTWEDPGIKTAVKPP